MRKNWYELFHSEESAPDLYEVLRNECCSPRLVYNLAKGNSKAFQFYEVRWNKRHVRKRSPRQKLAGVRLLQRDVLAVNWYSRRYHHSDHRESVHPTLQGQTVLQVHLLNDLWEIRQGKGGLRESDLIGRALSPRWVAIKGMLRELAPWRSDKGVLLGRLL